MISPVTHADAAPLSAPPDGDARAGTYALIRRIGSGGMGEVWLGRHVVSGGLGAVKRLNPAAARRAHLRAYFAREGRAVARLAHPHIVPVFEIGDDHLVSAFIDGSNLARRLQTSIEPAVAVRITRQIAAALAHAHSRGIVHRDVKPSNILLDAAGNAYLTDFGIAAMTDDDGDDVRLGGHVAGTPQFMAPEQRAGEPALPAADQYALGRTLLEMLAGGRVSRDPDTAVAELPATLPAALRDTVARATAAAPEDRFPSIAAFADTLAAIDLAAIGAPVRLAAELRAPARFGWCTAARRVTALGGDLARADYRLSELVVAGLLDAERARAFLATSGLADVGFTVWGSSARLGALTDPRAYARVAEIAILLHGWGNVREVWSIVAQAVCRDNAQALVLTPDCHGFGESAFARPPSPDQAALASMGRTALAWRALLGLDEIPTVLVGHSMGGIAVLSLDDHELGRHVSRMAINPVLVSHDPRLRRLFRRIGWVSKLFGFIPAVRRAGIRRYCATAPAMKGLTAETIASSVEWSMQMRNSVATRLLAAFAQRPPVLTRQHRVSVVVCVDDPMIDQRIFQEAIGDLGVRNEDVRRLATGGHMPHFDSADHPEWTARNVAEIVHEIDSMMLTAREAATHISSGPAPSTLIAGETGTTR